MNRTANHTRKTLFAAVILLTAGLLTLGCAAGNKGAAAAPAKAAAFWPPYPDSPRLQFLASFDSSSDVAPAKSQLDELIYGSEPRKDLDLAKPYGVAMHEGKIYICDLRAPAVTVLDLRNNLTLVLGQSGADTLQTPTDIAIAPDGMKYVSDIGRGAVYVFDQKDRQVGRFVLPGFKPAGLAVSGEELFVCNFKAQRVDVLNRSSGALMRSIGGPGDEPGQFIRPLGIAIDAKGFVYVVDVFTCKVQKFERSGKLVSGFGTVSANAGGLVRPKHMAIDRDGVLFVVDAAFQNVQLFDQTGQVLTYFGTAGTHPGAMYLPAGIDIHEGDLDLFAKYVHPAFEAKRLVIVTNQFGKNKVSVYAMGNLRPGHALEELANTRGMVPTGVSDGKSGATPGVPTALPAGAEAPADATTQPTQPTPTTEAPLQR